MAAEAIPRARWTEVEAIHSRYFYWQFLVNTWLVPGPAVLTDRDDPEVDAWTGPTPASLHENGWLLEPENVCEH